MHDHHIQIQLTNYKNIELKKQSGQNHAIVNSDRATKETEIPTLLNLIYVN